MLLQPPARPLLEVGTAPWSSTILANSEHGGRASSQLWHISHSPLEPRDVQGSREELQPPRPSPAGPALPPCPALPQEMAQTTAAKGDWDGDSEEERWDLA